MNNTAPTPTARLFAIENSPKEGSTRRVGTEFVTYGATIKIRRITDDDPSLHGDHLLGYEGAQGYLKTYRPATTEEIAALEAATARTATLAPLRERAIRARQAIAPTMIRTGHDSDSAWHYVANILTDRSDPEAFAHTPAIRDAIREYTTAATEYLQAVA